MLSITEALASSKKLSSFSDSPRIDCEVILSAAIDQTRTYLYTWPEKQLTNQQQKIFLQNLERRINGEPVAYIIGQKEFWSLALFVNESTLIPRPESELLVEVTLQLLADTNANDRDCELKIADLGTGTGAIALALASENSQWQIWGLENNKDALLLAKKNQQQLKLANVNLLLSDWFSALEFDKSNQKFNIIVSNPPYIDIDDKHLQEGDVRFEPLSALVAKNHGLADIETIIEQASGYLLRQGWLVFEHGNQQANDVSECFHNYGYQNIFTRNDLAGQPRVTGAQLY
jgi:release factor glutamine methyltransferase